MPGKYSRSRRSYRSRRPFGMYFARKPAARRIQRAWRKKRAFKRLKNKVYQNVQPGWQDIYLQPFNVDSVGVWKDITGSDTIVTGTEHDNRTGNKITLQKLSIKAKVQVAMDDQFNEVRLILVNIPCPLIGSTPSVQDILETSDVYSFYKKDSKVHYQIIWDKTYQLSNAHQSVGSLPAVVDLAGCPYKNYIHIEKKFKFNKGKGLPVWYQNNGLAPNINHVTKNHVWLLAISDSTNTFPTGAPTLGINARIKFAP